MRQYVVDAFTDQVFHGNQAAVCVMDQWIPEELMQNITRENNFSETAFAVKEGGICQNFTGKQQSLTAKTGKEHFFFHHDSPLTPSL